MKKFLPKLIIIILFVAVIFGGKAIIDKKTVNFEDVINKSLANYFITGDSTKLSSITELLDEYNSDENIKTNIKNYTSNKVAEWFTYLDIKYVCDLSNLNSCRAQLTEFESLNLKLKDLYKKKSKNGSTIINPSAYINLESEGEKKVENLKLVINNRYASNPKNCEEIRVRKCLSAVDCDSCREGVCKCFYVDKDKNREEITCYTDIQK